MAESVVLKLEHVSKGFVRVEKADVTHALRDVNLELRNGEFISLVGTSGCGKSTILRLIAGLIPPTTGKLTVNGVEITETEPQVGMVFQKPTLFPWMTVEKNISFGPHMRGRKRGSRERTEQMLKMIGLEEFRDDYPGQLSGGMAQRVALARTLINEPEILLLDEPLSALDAFTRMNIQDEILAIWQKQRQLVVMVTHDIDEAVYMGTKVVVMESEPGRIRAVIPIDLDYPRNRSGASFVAYRNQILDMLEYSKKEA